MNSTNGIGYTTITVQFALSRSIDAAAQDIQAAISKAGSSCRPICRRRRLSESQSGGPARHVRGGELAHAASLSGI